MVCTQTVQNYTYHERKKKEKHVASITLDTDKTFSASFHDFFFPFMFSILGCVTPNRIHRTKTRALQAES